MKLSSAVDRIVQFESGELSEAEVLELFCDLINLGLLAQLQGSYQRTARSLIQGKAIVNTPLGWKVPPNLEQLEAWSDEGGCEAIDGCWIEPDGTCHHGYDSWLLVLGLI